MNRGEHILLFGVTGQVGRQMLLQANGNFRLTPIDRSACDLTDEDAIRKVILDAKPDWIVNAAAYTAVDKAETDAAGCFAVNAVAPGVMAAAARECGARMIHYSTDYVFDGEKQEPYLEDDVTNPLGVYGKTKLEGERRIIEQNGRAIILRTSWVYGVEGHNFLRTMLRLGAERSELRVVNDQRGAPTSATAIAAATWRMIEQGVFTSGVYHMTAGGTTTWFGFARSIFAQAMLIKTPALIPIASSEYPTPAKRPGNSVLNNGKFNDVFGFRLPDWEEQLTELMAEYRNKQLQHTA